MKRKIIYRVFIFDSKIAILVFRFFIRCPSSQMTRSGPGERRTLRASEIEAIIFIIGHITTHEKKRAYLPRFLATFTLCPSFAKSIQGKKMKGRSF